MAEIAAFHNNALPYPIYGEQYTVTFPMLDADGDLVTGATTPDAERSINGDTFADCTAESTELATNSGMYYLTLTATEMTANILTIIAKSATAGMKTTALSLYPRQLPVVRTGTCADDGSGTGDVVLDSGASSVDDFYNGMVISVVIDGGASGEVRFITDYTGSTKTATVHKAFTAAVDNTDTFTIYQPETNFHLHNYLNKVYSDTTIIASDIVSHAAIISDIQSDTNVLLTKVGELDWSDIGSRLTITNSQILVIKSDTSDIISHLAAYDASAGLLSDINSGINALQVAIPAGEGDISDILSRLVVTNSQVLVIKSSASDILSHLAAYDAAAGLLSDIGSGVDAIQGVVGGGEGDISDILSRLTVTNSQIVVVKSDAAHCESKVVQIYSDTTHIDSDVTLNESRVLVIKSDVSDVLSAITIVKSDVISNALILSDANSGINAIQAGGGALTAGQASQLAQIQSDVISQFVVIEQNTSDTESALVKVYSDTTAIEAQAGASLTSDQDSKLTAIVTTVLTGGTLFEMVSDIYSDTTHIDSDVTLNESRVLVVKSDVSDVLSAITIVKSDVISNALILSDVQSDTNAILVKVGEGDWSDVLSRLVVTNSQLVVVKSDVAHIESDAVVIEAIVSDIQSDTNVMVPILSDVQSDTNALITKVGELDWSDIGSRLTITNSQLVVVKSDAAAIETKTASLTYTVANVVDANIQRVNDVSVNGTGAVGDEWGP